MTCDIDIEYNVGSLAPVAVTAKRRLYKLSDRMNDRIEKVWRQLIQLYLNYLWDDLWAEGNLLLPLPTWV